MNIKALPCIFALLGWPVAAVAEVLPVAAFEQGDLTGWQPQIFAGETRYRLAVHQGQRCLEADSQGAASGMFREVTVDLRRFPVLRWRWQVVKGLHLADETTKAADDFAARLFVVVSHGRAFWRSHALNYVWSAGQSVGSLWPSPHGEHTRMVAVASGAGQWGQWLTQRRHVRQDLRQWLGEEVDTIQAVAVMSDTDATGQQAVACYGDIHFESE